jgi:hypothetical protein
MLKNGVTYHDLGADHFSRRDGSKAIHRLVRRLNDLGRYADALRRAAS